MKKYLLALFLCSSTYAQSNYYALSYSNNILHALARYHFNRALYTDTTNTLAFTNFNGYVYPSNFNGLTTWEFPPRILQTTNAIVTVNLLTTNSGTVLGGFYRLKLFTNNLIWPFYDSGNVAWLVSAPVPNDTNLYSLTITNHFTNSVLSTNLAYLTNVNFGTFSISVGPISPGTPWYTLWITDGEIRF